MKIKYIDNREKCCKLNEKNGVTYITFPKLEKFDKEIIHGFSTRLGGVSKEHLAAMNLSFTRGDEPENVMENHRRFAATLGYDEKRLVFSDQVHKTVFHEVTESDCGKGIIRESDIKEIDGLVTNLPNIPMITFYADCVPLMFYDPKHKVIAMAHSGWKGTVGRIGAKMVDYMGSLYGSKPCDIICAIAPSICQECYEVSEDVAVRFIEEFADYINACDSYDKVNELIYKKNNGKYQLNLHKACEIVLTDAGVLKKNIDITDICTCCNDKLLFSHRASHGMRGNNAAVMMLKA
ncbi:MAG: peptidoglycan editing factor PgeF [Lachnospiraceae bacterium]|jgi:hypothetical protein|nr:peptidoglycan editing factor PgeF [Lachnospiraceae bacterium]